jgi:hypothetical protein
MLKKWHKIIITIFAIFGIFFFSILCEEIFHIIHGHNASAICISYNAIIEDDVQTGYIYSFSKFNINYDNVKTFNTWRELSEKYVQILNITIYILCGGVLGYIIKEWFNERRGVK